MDITVFLELFTKYGAGLGSTVSFIVLATIMSYTYRQNKKEREEDRKHSDKKFNQILDTQDKMMDEYKQGFIKVYNDLDKIDQRIKNLEGQQEENNLLALRSIIANNSLPQDYRLASYDSYKEKGGNSWVHQYVREEILGRDKKE